MLQCYAQIYTQNEAGPLKIIDQWETQHSPPTNTMLWVNSLYIQNTWICHFLLDKYGTYGVQQFNWCICPLEKIKINHWKYLNVIEICIFLQLFFNNHLNNTRIMFLTSIRNLNFNVINIKIQRIHLLSWAAWILDSNYCSVPWLSLIEVNIIVFLKINYVLK